MALLCSQIPCIFISKSFIHVFHGLFPGLSPPADWEPPGQRALGLIHLRPQGPAQRLAECELHRCLLDKQATAQMRITGYPGFLAGSVDFLVGAVMERGLKPLAWPGVQPCPASFSPSPLLHPSDLQPLLPRPGRRRWGRADSGNPSPEVKLPSPGMSGVWLGAVSPLSHLRGAVGLTQKESKKENFVGLRVLNPARGRGGGEGGGGEMPITRKVFRPHIRGTDTDLGSPGAAPTFRTGALRLGRGSWVGGRVGVLTCLDLLPSLSLSLFAVSNRVRPNSSPANSRPECQGFAQRPQGPGSQDQGERAAMV